MRFGWAGKAALGAAVPVVVGLLAFALVALNQVRTVTREMIEADQVNAVRVLAHALTATELESPGLTARIDTLAGEIEARVTVIDGTGRVVADSDVEAVEAMENHGQRPEVVEARAKGVGLVMRHSRTVGRELLYAAAPVPDSEAVVRIARDTSGVEARLQEPTRGFWLVALIVVLLGAAGAVLFSRGLTRPLVDLTAAAREMEAGDLDARVHPHGEDEMAQLGHAFNRMGEQLRETLGRSKAEAVRLSTILEAMNEGVVAVKADERISFVNGAARAILGLDPAEPLEGRRLYELVRDPSVLGLVEIAANTKQPAEAEIRQDGPPVRMVEVRAAPVGPEARGVILVLRDMSRLRRLEQMRSDFVSNVSHELRTPLASIAAAVETLEDEEVRLDAESGPRFLAMIRRNLGRLEALLNDILALSRLESRPETLPMTSVDLAAVVRAATEELQQHAAQAGVDLSVDAMARETVVGDEPTLRRVVDNLVVNAINYTPRGGKVAVRVSRRNGAAVLNVEDTGIGIPRDDLDRIFERFYRVDKARSRSAGGTGLGLAIVKHAVGLHGGTVSVRSELARGSSFTVLLPLAPAHGEPSDDQALPA